MDDNFDDFGDDMDQDFDDEDFHEDEFDHDITDDSAHETDGGFRPFPQWQDWMIIGPLSEEIAREKQLKQRIRKGFDRSKQ